MDGLGEKILARATLSLQQDGGGGTERDFLHHLDGVGERLGLAYDVTEVEKLFVAFSEVAYLLTELDGLQGISDRHREFLEFERLGGQGVGTPAPDLHPVLHASR